MVKPDDVIAGNEPAPAQTDAKPLFDNEVYACITAAINLGQALQIKKLDELKQVLSERRFSDEAITSALRIIAGAMAGVPE